MKLFLHCVIIISVLTVAGSGSQLHAKANFTVIQQDTSKVKPDSLASRTRQGNVNVSAIQQLNLTKKQNYLTVGDYVHGQHAGVYVKTPTAEPGAYQNILVRGITSPLFNNKDMQNNQAAIYVNGIPFIYENNFAYNIQRYDFNRIGPATEMGASIPVNSIESIEVVKDPIRLAELGPLAANGAILIQTLAPSEGKKFSFNSYLGMVSKPVVSPTNARYDYLFAKQFSDKYPQFGNTAMFPSYLRDSTDYNYYGNSNWKDDYFSNPFIYNADLGLTGGNRRANFSFFLGHTKSAISSDEVNLKRYNVLFNVRLLPFNWLTTSAFINARKIDRNRNRNFRDRYAEMDYIPDLSSPISPDKSGFNALTTAMDDLGLDDNSVNFIQGRVDVAARFLKDYSFQTSFLVDYNEGNRNLFYPKALMENVNFMSAYNGYTQRYMFSNKFTFNKSLGNHRLFGSIGSDYTDDMNRYLYSRVYNGPSDFIRRNIISGSTGEGEGSANLTIYRWNNRERFRMHSLYGSFNYDFNNLFNLGVVARWDGSSTVQKDKMWIFTPAAHVKWNIANQFETAFPISLNLAFSRIAKPNFSSKYATGPQYQSDLGWEGNPSVFSYFGFSGISRGYSFGWVGYDLDWAYTDRMEANLDFSLLKNRLNSTISLYSNETKNQIVLVPIAQEFGYAGQYKNGMAIQTQGVELSLNGLIYDGKGNPDKFHWNMNLNANFNRNEVTKLPDGLQSLKVGDRMLQVGSPVDAFWIYQNEGIYETDADLNPSLSFGGIPFQVGDAKWKDVNNDMIIDEKDRVNTGNFLPKVYGGFSNSFAYKRFNLDFSLTYGLGMKVLNQRAANKFGYLSQNLNEMNALQEVFNWQQDVNIGEYPIYNVWSNTAPYRQEQDLFLEDASFLKLRALTVGYDLSSSLRKSIKGIRTANLYVSGNNLLTVSKFYKFDPELTNFNGIYDGYGLANPPSFILGLKLDF